ncbi:MAG: hypothetical protein ABIV13_03160 [Fimbriimonadales bacterium]
MGAALVRFLLLVLVAVIAAGCGQISAETVRDKDRQRVEVSAKMPGNDVPPDPADSAR